MLFSEQNTEPKTRVAPTLDAELLLKARRILRIETPIYTAYNGFLPNFPHFSAHLSEKSCESWVLVFTAKHLY